MPPELPELCYLAFQGQDRLQLGALDAAQSRAAFGQLLRSLFPQGAPRPSSSPLLDRAFSEADQDLDGLLRLSEFSLFAARALQPMLRSKTRPEALPGALGPVQLHAKSLQSQLPMPDVAEVTEADVKGQVKGEPSVQGLKDWDALPFPWPKWALKLLEAASTAHFIDEYR